MRAPSGRQAVEWARNRNPWSGAEAWARTHSGRMYLLGLIAPWVRPAQRFVIVTPGRTGSELLVELLNSHPDIVCEPEILHERRLLPERFVAGRTTKAALSGAQAYGFKLHCGHFGYQALREHHSYLDELAAQGVIVVFLRRENLLAQAVSSVVASRTRWHWRRQDDATYTVMTLDPVEVLMMAYLFEESDHFLETVLHDLPHLRLTYEHDLLEPAAQQATVAKLCAQMGLTPVPTGSDHVRLSPPHLRDAVANFEELTALVRTTRFESFLDEGEGPQPVPR